MLVRSDGHSIKRFQHAAPGHHEADQLMAFCRRPITGLSSATLRCGIQLDGTCIPLRWSQLKHRAAPGFIAPSMRADEIARGTPRAGSPRLPNKLQTLQQQTPHTGQL